jgi:putative transposase
MPRTARVVIPGLPHHVTQRGNNRQDVFFTDGDREVYLDLLGRQCAKFGLTIEGYCLMTNHVHLIATPSREESLAKAVGRTNLYYTRHINRLHSRSGHLWQDRFFSCPLDDEYFWSAMIYVERNPVRARLVRKPWRWKWSSAAAHCDGKDPTGLLDLAAWAGRKPPDGDWRESICRPQAPGAPGGDEAVVTRIRRWSNRGCPLGSDSFISKLETLLNRRLRPHKRGRPRKRKPTKNGNRPD